RYGVARVGSAKKKVNLPSFLAMFTKHFINVVYFIQVAGWNKVFSYLKHEFFTIRNRRSFVGGHFSNRTPSFLLVALRVWLGLVWINEGVMKIVAGWFEYPKLTTFFSQANDWFNSILTDTASGATDAASAATGVAAEPTGTVLFNIDFLGLFRAIFVSGKELAQSSISDFGFKLDIPLVNWFVENVVLSTDTMQIIMQVLIVAAEILIGLALIGGLFTTPASAASLVLMAMFVTTTGLFLSSFWMIFAAIALLIGAGRIFGLDYYVMPCLKSRWKKIGIVRKSYLYHD
ncbi:MAG TPA: pyridine nucleotide-disulfide oxidoreductase, partial [Clostridia bacterium]|nr:pyridine nucleotide-disulfide oxidoreductase [Clostridia bacterium]